MWLGIWEREKAIFFLIEQIPTEEKQRPVN